MTFAWAAAKVVVVLAVLTIAFNLLPPASVYDTGELTIPDVVWNPIAAVLGLGRLLPVATMLILLTFTLAIQTGLVLWWLMSWILRHTLGGS